MKSAVVCSLVQSALALTFASLAQADESAAGAHAFTANVGVFSQYVFRGLAQTNEDPAIQGGFDYAHDSGFYAGTWASNISWFSDTNGGSVSMEWDFYAGYKRTWAGGLTTDVGYLRYQYPGTYPTLSPGTVKPNTDEAYIGLGYKWATLKYSYAFSDLFGVEDGQGGSYLDLTVSIPLPQGFALALHAGQQTFEGRSAYARSIGTTNDALFGYEDYKATLSYGFGAGWTLSGTYTHSTAKDAGYTVLNKNLGDDHFVLGLSRAL